MNLGRRAIDAVVQYSGSLQRHSDPQPARRALNSSIQPAVASVGDSKIYMISFAIAVFVSAFLLFQVQPIVARYILPWFGGSPAVWTVCMLFFQAGLLCGYSYARLLAKYIQPRLQPVLHLGLLAVSLLMLPITPNDDWLPTGASANPTLYILALLLVSVGFPFAMISASAPLLQHWFAETFPGKSPYRLYALSNLGSLIALLSYPFIVEPQLTLQSQTVVWSIGYAAFIIVCGWCALPLLRGGDRGIGGQVQSTEPAQPISWWDKCLWIVLAATGSTVLLATTNQMCQDVAVVPFLWILPLSLYLLSFIICFDNDRWYQRDVWVPVLFVSVGSLVFLMHQDFASVDIPLVLQIIIYSAAMFACCMVCHGELVRRRPPVGSLTSFYLYVALGGALGGVFVNLLAPLMFNGFWEFHGSLVATFGLAAVCIFLDKAWHTSESARTIFSISWGVILIVLIFWLGQHIQEQREDSIANVRSFYGVLHVYEYGAGSSEHKRSFYHGRINHGSQWLSGDKRFMPTTYFGPQSGIAIAFAQFPRPDVMPDEPDGLKIGVAGLGVGAVSVHAKEADHVRFYEINPQIETIARDYFTYLTQGPSTIDVVLGDARISMNNELTESGSRQYDLLVLDAFSGDSIPIHLLTEEAFALYWQHLKPNGILAIQITNLYVDLSDVVRLLASRSDKSAIRFTDTASDWVLVTDNPEFLQDPRVALDQEPWPTDEPKPILWTDDFSNLFGVLY